MLFIQQEDAAEPLFAFHRVAWYSEFTVPSIPKGAFGKSQPPFAPVPMRTFPRNVDVAVVEVAKRDETLIVDVPMVVPDPLKAVRDDAGPLTDAEIVPHPMLPELSVMRAVVPLHVLTV